MTEIVYYVATSLDGYIATSDGGVEWLSSFETEGEDQGYAEFYATIDALLIGRRTYQQVLGFGDWPYPGKPCWVVSRQPLTVNQPDVVLTSASPQEIVAELQAQRLKRVWLVGGATLAAAFQAGKLIDEYIITLMPILLGAGIPVMPRATIDPLQRVKCTSYSNGAVQLHYRSR